MSPRVSRTDGGDCFPTAGRIAIDPTTPSEWEDLRVVHATVTGRGPIAGVAMQHAWVEATVDGERVAIDRSNGLRVALPVDAYRAIGQARDVREYDRAQVSLNMIRTQHWGPWEGPGSEKGEQS